MQQKEFDMNKVIREDGASNLSRTISVLFIEPWIYMVAWGALLHMTGWDLPFLSYWQVFMLNIVCGILTQSGPIKWIIEEKE